MSHLPALTRNDRAERHRRIVASYQDGRCSRTVAELFGMSDGHVRAVVRLYGAARRPGRPV